MPNPNTMPLKRAQIIEAEDTGSSVTAKRNGISVDCMFNPQDYTVSQTSSYTPEYENGSDVPKMVFTGAGERVLKLNTLYFDTYEQKTDVTQVTRKLFALMKPSVEQNAEGDNPKKRPSPILFQWGTLEFAAVITSCSQKFTLFLRDGTPVRAEVTVELKRHLKSTMYQDEGQNPTSMTNQIERIWQVKAGDRLDLIAAEVYRDSTKWRLIAARNDLDNPLSIRAGQFLRIPPKSYSLS